MWDKLFYSSTLLQKGLDASWKRSSVIANNIANNDTPGFKSSKVEFETTLARALETDAFAARKTREGHMDIGTASLDNIRPIVITPQDSSMRMDENNVDIEQEMADMAKNSIYYYTLTSKISKDLGLLKIAITSK